MDELAKAIARMRLAKATKAEWLLKAYGIEKREDFPGGLRVYVDPKFPGEMIGIFTEDGEQVLDLRSPSTEEA